MLVSSFPSEPEDPHKKVGNDDIDALFDSVQSEEKKEEDVKVTNDSVEELLKEQMQDQLDSIFDTPKSEEKREIHWNATNLTSIPGSYMKKKLAGRDADELADILAPLSDSNRYYMTTHMAKDVVQKVVKLLEERPVTREDSTALDSFLKEVDQDYQNGDFDVDEKNVA